MQSTVASEKEEVHATGACFMDEIEGRSFDELDRCQAKRKYRRPPDPSKTSPGEQNGSSAEPVVPADILHKQRQNKCQKHQEATSIVAHKRHRGRSDNNQQLSVPSDLHLSNKTIDDSRCSLLSDVMRSPVPCSTTAKSSKKL